MLEAFLVSVFVMCAINTLLALVMVLADATIANYGEVSITVNGKKELKVEGGRNLLSTLKEQGIFIPSACGGRGSCGLCKVRALDGAGDYLPTELPFLSKEEQRNNVRLACQIKVKRPLQIAIPEDLFRVRQYETTVESIRDLTHDIKELRLRLPVGERMERRAGDFVQVEVPAYELTSEPVYRAYSMSNAPSEEDIIELEVRLVPNGICTTYVHSHIKEGDRLTINGPYGEFCLSDTEREMICIAGGSGMAPIKSILQHMAEKGIRRKCRYFFGARSRRDLFLVDDMKAIGSRLHDFEFIPALSEPAPADRWDGQTGLITEIVDAYYQDVSEAEAYLCGSPLMIDACIEVLSRKGMPREHIFYDKFA